jgi:5-methylcytosine-specific restriction endonuclease McrA
MSYEKRYPNWEQMVRDASESAPTASAAAANLGVKIDTYRKYAKKYGCYKTNQSGKGLKYPSKGDHTRFSLEDILAGKQPQYSTNKLKLRLYKEGLKEPKCEECGIEEWQGKPITMHLDHIDGNSKNHKLDNLRVLCPNCHSQTDTYCGRNKKAKIK